MSETIKYALVLCFIFINSKVIAEEWTREYSGYRSTEEFVLTDGSKISHLKIHGTWKDSLGNYGTQRCLGTVEIDSNNKILGLTAFCQGVDQNKHEYTTKPYRDTDMDAGTGAFTYIDGNGIYKDLIGVTCKYAINYFENVFFEVDRCKKNKN